MASQKSNFGTGLNSVKFTKSNIFWGVLFVAGLVCMWMTQREVPVMMDDEWYSTILSAETPLQSLGDVVDAQVWHYNNWGGRTVAHTIAQLILLYLSPAVADVLNVAVTVLLAWLICVVAGEKKLAYVTLVTGFLHGLNADWKMSMYWQTGACNYLYTTVIILGFLWMYLKVLDKVPDNEQENKQLGLIVPASVLGLLCGWTNENMGPAVWVLTILVMLVLKREKRKIRPWMVAGSLTCMIGSMLMILAPGNGVRSAQVTSNEYGVLWQIFLRMYSACKGAWDFLFPVIVITAAVVVANVVILGNRLRKSDVMLLIGALLSWGAMILSPHYPDRAAFGTMCLLLCVVVSQAIAVLRTKDTRACTITMSGIGVFIWLRGMYFLGEFLAICWGWIR